MYNFYLKNGMRLPLDGRMRKLLLIMKLTTLILITVILHVSAASLAQKVTLKEKNVPLVDIFNQISTQTGYDFAFTTEALKDAKPVTINVKNEELKDVLNQIFEGQNLDFSLDNKIVVIKPKEQSYIDKVKAAFAAIDVTGRVTDENNQPLAGATITVKGENNSTTSDSNGFFTLKNVQTNAVIVITFIGYDKRELVAQSNLAIKLTTATSPLDEVKVIAYGQTTDRLSVGNVSSVSAKQIEQQPVSNPLLALEGTTPGLFISQSTGLPGAGVTVRIQGQNSILNGNDPLYVIDGVPFAQQLLPQLSTILRSSGQAANTAGTAGSPLSYINPNDIESISILKDADATAIYGSRAANGAILITTKKGKAGATKVDVNLQSGIGKVTRFLPLLNTTQYLQMRHEAYKNDNATLSPNDFAFDLDGTWDTTRTTNWQKVLLGGTARYTDLNGSVSGGTTNTQFLAGGTYHKETTVFPGNLYDEKGSVHFSLTTRSTNQKFNFLLTGSYLFDNNHLQDQDLTNAALTLPPDAPQLKNPDGSINYAPFQYAGQTYSSFNNPLLNQNNPYINKTGNLLGNASLSYEIIPGLLAKTTLGYNNIITNEFTGYPFSAQLPENRSVRAAFFGQSNVNSWIVEPQLSYRKQIGKSSFDMLLGGTIQQRNYSQTQQEADGANSDAVIQNIAAATSFSILTSSIGDYKYNALFTRLNYNWDGTYIVNVNVRRDGSSRFGDRNQFHNFGSVGLGWVFSNYSEVTDLFPALSYGKFRGSYGVTGNDQIGDYRFLSLYSNNSYAVPYRGVASMLPTGIANPYIQWEETRKLQAGFDLGFLKDRILFSFTFSQNRSSNQLLNYALPILTGFNSITSNFPATVQNSDLEFTLTTTNVKNKDFRWSSNINLTIPKNKLIAFQDLATSSYSKQYFIGEPINQKLVYDYVGVDPTTGLYTFKNSQGQITSAINTLTDNTVHIPLLPKIYGGFQNTFQFKSLELSFLIMGVKQDGQNLYFGSQPGVANQNQPVTVLNRWQKPGDNAAIQRFSTSDPSALNAAGYVSASNAGWSDASYLRLKNVSFSWQIPDKLKHALQVSGMRIYAQAQNLFTITRYAGLDPENLSFTSLPPLRVITVGTQITF